MKLSLRRGRALGLGAVLLAVLVGGSGAAPAGTASAPCAGPDCARAITASPRADDGVRLADSVSRRRFKRDQIVRCCRKYRAGLPLKGYYCSAAVIHEAYVEGICTFDRPPPRAYSPLFF